MRFTPQDIEAYRKAGVDVSNVKTRTDLEHAIERWALAVADERPDLLEKIATEMASRKGEKLPPKLTVITPSDDSPQQS